MQINPHPYPEKKSQKPSRKGSKPMDKGGDDSQDARFAGLTRPQFVSWLKTLPNEERYLTLKVTCPKLILPLIDLNARLGDNWKVEVQNSRPPTKLMKSFMAALQAFIDGLVLISDQDYLDSLGFDFSFVCCPEKLFDMLCTFAYGWGRLTAKGKGTGEEGGTFLPADKEEWIYEVFRVIEADYRVKVKSIWDPSLLERQKNEKKEFGNFWRNMPKNSKLNFLLLGHQDVESLVHNLYEDLKEQRDSQSEGEEEKENVEAEIIENQINELIGLDKKQICNKVFKSKIKRCSTVLCLYYEMIYRNWRDFASKKKPESKGNKKKGKNQTQNQGQSQPQVQEQMEIHILEAAQKHKEQQTLTEQQLQSPITNRRQKSLDQWSNQTNESQQKPLSPFELPSEKEILHQLQEDLLQCTDSISEQSNKYHERRVLAYERISAIFRLYSVDCRLFGSCANGLAIRASDIDIAINEGILTMFGGQRDKRVRMDNAFQFMGGVLEGLPWVRGVKVIKTAAIPIIKLTVDTNVDVEEEYFTEEYREMLNRRIENGGEVHADLTIQLLSEQNQSSTHLGLISTTQINSWLAEIPSLRPIALLLKSSISAHNLNETYLGGLNTYCLVVMIVSYIYHAGLQNEENSALVLMGLLRFYGWDFAEGRLGVDLRGRGKDGIYYEKGISQGSYADLEVKDPLNNGKVMTRNCYEFPKIREIFQGIYTNCLMEKQKLMKEQCYKISKRLSKRKTKQESETESGSEKERAQIQNFFLELKL